MISTLPDKDLIESYKLSGTKYDGALASNVQGLKMIHSKSIEANCHRGIWEPEDYETKEQYENSKIRLGRQAIQIKTLHLLIAADVLSLNRSL
jgi:hypothetical protein